jgi:hypothetical protein
MQINLIPDSSVGSAPAGFTAAVQAAADIYDQDFAGNYTVNITYGWGTFDNAVDPSLTNATESLGGVIGNNYVNYATAKSWLTANATLGDQKVAVASLPASDTSFPGDANSFFVSSAEEKAFGVFAGSNSSIDGSMGFGTASFDWEGLALCEIGHALGWLTNYYAGAPSILDLFRYASVGEYQWTGGQAAYFSTNGGTTDQANFATSFDYTLFTNLTNDPFDAPVTSSTLNLTNLDIEVLNDLGFGAKSQNSVIGDFNGGSTSDVLWINPANDTVGDWLMNNGTPTWNVVGQGSSTASIKGFGDFTGNGISDVLWENPTNGIVGDWLMNNNQPTWQQIGQGSTTMNIAGVGDFNGDGTSDILWQNPTNNYIGIWQMQNNTPTWEAVGYGSTTANIVGVGDFTETSKDDILWENPTNGVVGVWAMNGSTPIWSVVGQGSTTMQIVGVGDFRGSGTDEVLWENPSNGVVGFWGMNGGQATSWNVVGTANTSYQVAGVGDYYGNGISDILWRNPTSGDVGIWAISNGQATWHDLGSSSTAFSVVKT